MSWPSRAAVALAAVLALAMVIAAVRVARAPSLPNRVVALDTVAVAGIALTALSALVYEEKVFLDVAILLALVNFVGTVAFARYVERKRPE